MDTKKYFMVLLVIMMIFCESQAQNNLNVTTRNTTSFDMTAILAAGNHTDIVIDNTQWINYAYDFIPTDPYASILVGIASGTIPPGMEIYIQAGYYNGSGRGKAGRPTGKIKLGNIPTVLINDIGSVDTGHGKHKGHQLTLSIVITDYALLQPGDYLLNLQYTLKQ